MRNRSNDEHNKPQAAGESQPEAIFPTPINDAAAGDGPERSPASTGPDAGGQARVNAAEKIAGSDCDDAALRAKQALPDFLGEGGPSNTPSPKTIGGGEDYAKVGLYLDYADFESIARVLDEAQLAAVEGRAQRDEVQLGDTRFIVAPGGARQGSGGKGPYMRWRLTGDNGLVLLLMNRDKPHETQPNGMVQIGSVPLMQHGLDAAWGMTRDVLAALGAKLVADKLSRVDACVDLAGVSIDEFMQPFRDHWCVSRALKRAEYEVGVPMQSYFEGRRATGFVVGKHPQQLRVYDKLTEALNHPEKLALLIANRWGELPTSAVRTEYELGRERLKQYGVDSLADWIAKRGAICNYLTTDWFRLTDGPVDRRHADRAGIHPVWQRVRETFVCWCGSGEGVRLVRLAGLPMDLSRRIAVAVGILKNCFAQLGKQIEHNEQFLREVRATIWDAIRDRDMGEEVRRRTLELGWG